LVSSDYRERIYTKELMSRVNEATFVDTLEIVKKLDAKQTILTHIEETDHIGYDDLQRS
jgi:phosphoribosyl 1,2-cyclic phosphate phosphodiesterase